MDNIFEAKSKDIVIKELENLYNGFYDEEVIKSFFKDNNLSIYAYNLDTELLKLIYQNEINKDNIKLRAFMVDACYGTNVRRFKHMDKILEILFGKDDKNPENIDNDENFKKLIDILKKINNGNNPEEICNSIAKIIAKCKNDEYFPFSFLTKFFACGYRYSTNNPKEYYLPIYDRYVQEFINKYPKDKLKNKFTLKTNNENIYNEFYETMEQIAKNEGVNFEQLDSSIWSSAKIIPEIINEIKFGDTLLPKDSTEQIKNFIDEIKFEEKNYKEYFISRIKESIKNKIAKEIDDRKNKAK